MTYRDNVLSVWDKTSESDREAGREWYPNTFLFCAGLDSSNPQRAAGVVAALSPNTSWPLNRGLAETLYGGETPGTFGDAIEKATRILEGESPESVLRGPKVIPFYRNIIGDTQAITIDRHCIAIAHGGPLYSSQLAHAWRTPARRELLFDAFRWAAGKAKTEPSRLQATVWHWWRRNVAAAYFGE